jgi:hypothetical protein
MTAQGALVATLAQTLAQTRRRPWLHVIAHGPDRAALQPPPIAR